MDEKYSGKTVIFLVNCLKVCVFLALLVLTLNSLIRGPIKTAWRNETFYKTNFKRLDNGFANIPGPMLGICKDPFYKSKTKYREFMAKLKMGNFTKKSDLEAAMDEVFYTKPEDYVLHVSIATDYPTAVIRQKELPIVNYTTTFVSDLLYFGYCAEVNIADMKYYMINKGDIGPDEPDFDYSVIVWFKGSNNSQGANRMVIYPKGERLAAGANTIIPVDTKSVRNGFFGVYFIRYKLYRRIRKCDEGSQMTRCIMSKVDKNFTDTPEGFFAKNMFVTNLKLSNSYQIYNKTGCSQPCMWMEYGMQEFALSLTENMNDGSEIVFEDSADNLNGMAIFKHSRSESILEDEELPEYTTESLISDIGGLTGIFLGISFWSVFADLSDLVIKRLFKQ